MPTLSRIWTPTRTRLTTVDAVGSVTIVPRSVAIRHASGEHSRVVYSEQYDADADDVRRREAWLDAVDAHADVEAVVARLDVDLDDS